MATGRQITQESMYGASESNPVKKEYFVVFCLCDAVQVKQKFVALERNLALGYLYH